MKEDRPCPTCHRVPVATKTWNRLTAQDDLIKRLRTKITKLEEELVELGSEVGAWRAAASERMKAEPGKQMTAEEFKKWLWGIFDKEEE